MGEGVEKSLITILTARARFGSFSDQLSERIHRQPSRKKHRPVKRTDQARGGRERPPRFRVETGQDGVIHVGGCLLRQDGFFTFVGDAVHLKCIRCMQAG